MFVPKMFEFEDKSEQIAFMKQYSFATIITNKGDIPIATQLPFIVEERAGTLFLSGHFAKANEQANYIEQMTSLIIFSEPHAYISPTHYEKIQSVPTWDYISVHAYGKAKIITDDYSKILALEQMIRFYEPEYVLQWNQLSDKYKNAMIKGIVGFEIEVTDIQGQKKLSQNKTELERNKIVNHLQQQGQVEQDLASYIKNL
ncbi:FMN-binding negative transcriptional regulator [Flavobacterium sp. HSC-61S13]|uniref:FMN-binding negative transcriptional regulator n=1 Tax=Flavobacterium sp. HSC-61S13 TaxID=2910963 RepID=UPI00209FB93F|nr:FMN-binding negative transcriptional regulator [Flavobacterium sp. HSC-61S13]MCP1997039.1 transcriptional regulator [Flavobacterium sp. HSC-61S13]